MRGVAGSEVDKRKGRFVWRGTGEGGWMRRWWSIYTIGWLDRKGKERGLYYSRCVNQRFDFTSTPLSLAPGKETSTTRTGCALADLRVGLVWVRASAASQVAGQLPSWCRRN